MAKKQRETDDKKSKMITQFFAKRAAVGASASDVMDAPVVEMAPVAELASMTLALPKDNWPLKLRPRTVSGIPLTMQTFRNAKLIVKTASRGLAVAAFSGQTGIGKTTTALAVACEAFGNDGFTLHTFCNVDVETCGSDVVRLFTTRKYDPTKATVALFTDCDDVDGSELVEALRYLRGLKSLRSTPSMIVVETSDPSLGIRRTLGSTVFDFMLEFSPPDFVQVQSAYDEMFRAHSAEPPPADVLRALWDVCGPNLLSITRRLEIFYSGAGDGERTLSGLLSDLDRDMSSTKCFREVMALPDDSRWHATVSRAVDENVFMVQVMSQNAVRLVKARGVTDEAEALCRLAGCLESISDAMELSTKLGTLTPCANAVATEIGFVKAAYHLIGGTPPPALGPAGVPGAAPATFQLSRAIKSQKSARALTSDEMATADGYEKAILRNQPSFHEYLQFSVQYGWSGVPRTLHKPRITAEAMRRAFMLGQHSRISREGCLVNTNIPALKNESEAVRLKAVQKALPQDVAIAIKLLRETAHFRDHHKEDGGRSAIRPEEQWSKASSADLDAVFPV